MDFHIMLIEDDRVDQKAIERALKRVKRPVSLTVTTSVPDALRVLTSIQNVDEAPDVIITDLKMPEHRGTDLLDALKVHSRFRRLPVVVLTTSVFVGDATDCYERGASGFFVKPSSSEELVAVLESIIQYWDLALYRKVHQQ